MKYIMPFFKHQLSIIQKLEFGITKIILTVMVETFLVGPHLSSQKYKYSFGEHDIDCMMVRMIYFVHDCRNDQGAFFVSPATHKSNLPSPYNNNPDTDQSMFGLEEAGDAILFTESLDTVDLAIIQNNHAKQYM